MIMALWNKLLLILYLAGFATSSAGEDDGVWDPLLKAQWSSSKDITRLLADEPDTDTQNKQTYGQRCGRRNACVEGLVCEFGDLPLANRCIPDRNCLEERLIQFEATYDMEMYKQQVFEQTGVSEEELVRLFRESKSRKVFIETETTRSLMDAIHTVLAEPAKGLRVIQQDCAGLVMEPRSESQDEQDGDELGTFYVGFQIEAGALFEGTFQYLQSEAGTSFYRGCFGALGVGAEFSLVLGQSLAPSDGLMCFSLMFDLDAGAVLNLGAAGGIQSSGWPFIEFTVGGGLSASAGVNTCYADQAT